LYEVYYYTIYEFVECRPKDSIGKYIDTTKNAMIKLYKYKSDLLDVLYRLIPT